MYGLIGAIWFIIANILLSGDWRPEPLWVWYLLIIGLPLGLTIYMAIEASGSD